MIDLIMLARDIPDDLMEFFEPCDKSQIKDVFSLASEPSTEAHYASYPTEIPRRCIRLGCPPDGVVYDPFMGSGTTAAVAIEQGRAFVGSELNSDYVAICNKRIAQARQVKAISNGQTVTLAPHVTQHGLFD